MDRELSPTSGRHSGITGAQAISVRQRTGAIKQIVSRRGLSIGEQRLREDNL